MSTVSSQVSKLIAAIVLAAFAVAHAQTSTSAFTIKRVRTGWAADAFALESNDPVLNPANCPMPDAYQVDITVPGYKTHLAAALTAYASGKPVVVVVSNAECINSRPKIWGIYF